jgi:pyruvate,water dikinase
MAVMAASDSGLVALLSSGSVEAAEERMRRNPRLESAYRGYLDRFGDRCMQELKLESPTLHDDPRPLLRSIGAQAAHFQLSKPPSRETRAAAEQRIRSHLRGQPLRMLLFKWVLHNARGRLRDRENMRFERTRVFGQARRLFLRLGAILHSGGALADARDVFYLEVEEVLRFVDGTATTTDLDGLVDVRKREYGGYGSGAPGEDWFQTRGPVGLAMVSASDAPVADDAESRRGIPCSAGIVRGPVRIVEEPQEASIRAGEILAARQTDPGWVLLFPAAAGLLVERGSPLSHSAIVAREMGLPAVVAVSGLTRWLRDGDWVEMDGSTGSIRKLVRPPDVHMETREPGRAQ